jgi:hypothetical protein
MVSRTSVREYFTIHGLKSVIQIQNWAAKVGFSRLLAFSFYFFYFKILKKMLIIIKQ